ncbi:MAG: hypothetical protein AAF170_09685 [Bacteroidota bacterium]
MDPFAPSLLAQAITGLFAVATLLTGSAALFANKGFSLLVRTEDFSPVNSDEIVTAPNVRGWGVRQIVTGVCLWAALILGHQVLFQVGLLSLLIRQGLDIVLYLLDGMPRRTVIFVAAAIPTLAAFVGVL